MKRTHKRYLALLMSLTILFASAVPAYAAETTDEAVFYEFLVSGIEAAEAIDEFEELTQVEIRHEDFAALNIDQAWLADARSLLEELYPSEANGIATASSTEERLRAEAKASAISYSIDRAQWSISQNRASDLASEAQYMFISHYIDRNDYYWNQQNIALLQDGPQRSGPNGALAQWLTATDRQTYDTYLRNALISESIRKIGSIATGMISIIDNHDAIQKAKNDYVITKDILKKVGAELTTLNSISTGIDVYTDFRQLLSQTQATLANTPIELSILYDTYLEDPKLLPEYENEKREKVISCIFAVYTGLCIGNLSGGVNAVLDAIKGDVLELGIETYAEFFDYTRWLAMQYSYSSRYSLRFMSYNGM